jgi:LAS superfamily LD-carboxypeptidase LdcB
MSGESVANEQLDGRDMPGGQTSATPADRVDAANGLESTAGDRGYDGGDQSPETPGESVANEQRDGRDTLEGQTSATPEDRIDAANGLEDTASKWEADAGEAVEQERLESTEDIDMQRDESSTTSQEQVKNAVPHPEDEAVPEATQESDEDADLPLDPSSEVEPESEAETGEIEKAEVLTSDSSESDQELAKKADPRGLLPGLTDEMQKKVKALIRNAHAKKLNIQITAGKRSVEDQDKLYQKGRRGIQGEKTVTKAKGGNSFHQYGTAVDVVFSDKNGNPSWSEKHDWNALGQAGKDAGLEWGGDWKKNPDRPHFELPGQDISKLKKQAKDRT